MVFTKQRRYPRAKVSIPVEWGTAPNCGYKGVILILGLGGCLIQAPLYASPGRAVFVRLELPEEGEDAHVLLRGHIKYQMKGMGLGVEFMELTDEEKRVIGGIVNSRLQK